MVDFSRSFSTSEIPASSLRNSRADAQALFERQQRTKGINALADIRGEQFLAPVEAVAVTSSDRAERKFGAEQKRLATSAAQKLEDRERADLGRATEGAFNLLELNTNNNVPIEQTLQQIAPVLKALNTSDDDIRDIVAGLSGQDPLGFIQSLRAGLVGPQKRSTASRARPEAAFDAEGNPVFVGRDDSGNLVQLGGEFTPARPVLSQKQIDARNRQIKVQEDKIDAEKVRKLEAAKKLGGAEGARAAEDLPLSQAALDQLTTKSEDADLKLETLTTNIEATLDKVSSTSAGFASSTAFIPGSPASQLRDQLLTVTARALIDALSSLKSLSSTGASGFGQLNKFEGEALRSSEAALAQSQTPDDLRGNLKQFLDIANSVRRRIKRATKRQRDLGKNRTKGEPSIDDLLDKFAPVEQ